MLHIDPLQQVLVDANAVSRTKQAAGVGEGQRLNLEEVFDLLSQRRQYRLEVKREQAERFDARAAHILQSAIHAFLLGQLPGLVLVDIRVDPIGQLHDFAQRLAGFTLGVKLGDLRRSTLQVVEQGVAIG